MFRVLFGRLRIQDYLGWRSTLKELSSSRRGNRFWYINHLNPSSYAKVRGNILQTEPQRKCGARCQTLVWWVVRVIRPSKPSTQKSFVSSSRSTFIYNSSQSEVVWGPERQIKIRLCFQSGNQSEKLTIRVKTYRSSESLSSEWTYYHPSENIVIWVKLSFEWSYSEWKDYRQNENLTFE